MAILNIAQMLVMFGVHGPQTLTLTQRPLERMVSRDAIRLVVLLLVFPANLEGKKPPEVGQNGDGTKQ